VSQLAAPAQQSTALSYPYLAPAIVQKSHSDHIHDPNGAIAGTIEAVLGKLQMVQERLKKCSLSDLEEQKNLCKLIKMYTETLKALKKVQ
jgi:hypothetical protein